MKINMINRLRLFRATHAIKKGDRYTAEFLCVEVLRKYPGNSQALDVLFSSPHYS